MYKQTRPIIFGGEITSVIRTTDGACIPFAPDNTDYQEFLGWKAEQSVLKRDLHRELYLIEELIDRHYWRWIIVVLVSEEQTQLISEVVCQSNTTS